MQPLSGRPLNYYGRPGADVKLQEAGGKTKLSSPGRMYLGSGLCSPDTTPGDAIKEGSGVVHVIHVRTCTCSYVVQSVQTAGPIGRLGSRTLKYR